MSAAAPAAAGALQGFAGAIVAITHNPAFAAALQPTHILRVAGGTAKLTEHTGRLSPKDFDHSSSSSSSAKAGSSKAASGSSSAGKKVRFLLLLLLLLCHKHHCSAAILQVQSLKVLLIVTLCNVRYPVCWQPLTWEQSWVCITIAPLECWSSCGSHHWHVHVQHTHVSLECCLAGQAIVGQRC